MEWSPENLSVGGPFSLRGDPGRLTDELIASVLSVTVEPDPPPDFAAFWQDTVAALEKTPLDLELVPAADGADDDGVERYVWTATSLGGRRISGPLTLPRQRHGRLPQWVYGHGYGSVRAGTTWRPDLARAGFIAVGLDARGYGRSRRPGDPDVPGWILQGIESPAEYILRGAVADTIRAVQVARSLADADPRRTVLTGGSFSGGLAILAAPWIAGLRYLAVSVPTFGAYGLRRTLVEQGSGKEVNDLLDSVDPQRRAAILNNLRYFDAVNAAAFIRSGPVSVGLGVIDVVVPGETVAAIYHALATPDKELLHYPCAHSAHPLSGRWRHWEEHIFERARQLV